MTPPTLHVVFTPSGAGCLKPALANAGRDDQVIAFFDSLSFGPINPPDSSLRAKWVENELGWTGWDEITAKSDRFWHEALAPGRRKVARGCRDDRHWNMPAFLNGCRGWETNLARLST